MIFIIRLELVYTLFLANYTDSRNRVDQNSNHNDENLIWIDLEMTGLDTVNDEIIEIATIVTDKELNILAEGPMIAIHLAKSRLDQMDEWNQNQHGKSGLIKRVLDSQYTLKQAEQETIVFLEKYVSAGKSPMCGNSICQDRRFLARQMPALEEFFILFFSFYTQTFKFFQVVLPAITNGFGNQVSQLRVGRGQPASWRDTIGFIVEFFRPHFIKVMKQPLLQELRMQLGNAIDREAADNGQPSHADLWVWPFFDDRHTLQSFNVTRPAHANLGKETRIDLIDNFEQSRQ